MLQALLYDLPGPHLPGTLKASSPALSMAMAEPLFRLLPAAAVEKMVRISKQLQFAVIDPITLAATPDESAREARGLFKTFCDYYFDLVQVVIEHIGLDGARLAALTEVTYRAAGDLVLNVGREWLGEEAALSAVFGFSTMAAVSKAAVAADTAEQDDPEAAHRLLNIIFAYGMISACLLAPISDLASGKGTEVKPAIATRLIAEAEELALEAYSLTKQLGLIEPVHIEGEIGGSSEEDIELANAGLLGWAEALDRLER